MDFTTNYCGMYWSDGKVQPSVADGKTVPVSELDSSCKMHDSAYALAEDDGDLDVADTKFYNNTSHLGLRGRLYGNLVFYGNKVLRFKPGFMGNVLENSAKFGPEAAKRRSWLRGMQTPPDEDASAASGDAASVPPGATTVYDPESSCPSGLGVDTPVHGGSVYTSAGFASYPEAPRPSPFAYNGFYKPLMRKKKRIKVKFLSRAERNQLLAALIHSES